MEGKGTEINRNAKLASPRESRLLDDGGFLPLWGGECELLSREDCKQASFTCIALSLSNPSRSFSVNSASELLCTVLSCRILKQ